MWQLTVLFFATSSVLAYQDCRIKIGASDKRSDNYVKAFQWTRPKHHFGSAETIEHGTIIEFTCRSGFVTDDLVGPTYNFECTNGKFNRTLEYEDLLCRATYHSLTETYQVSPTQFGSKIFKCDQKDWEVIQVRTKKTDGTSRLLYTVCFDSKFKKTKFVFQPRNDEVPGKLNVTRRDVWSLDRFGKTAFEKLKLSEGYVPSIQQDRITKAFPERYSPRRKYPYTFHRGHLAPYADFISIEDRKASCEYINIAPQWKELNAHSWSLIERETREMVKSSPYNWEIYTGTYSSIPTTKGPLYVSPYFDKKGILRKANVPVPKLFWKIAYNVMDKTLSKVFVGVNNPELRSPAEFTDKYVICKPIVDENGNKFKGSEYKGFTYECKLEEFIEKLRSTERIVI